jgi:hypothetical protein
MWSKHSRRIDPISRSAKPLCQGEAGAVGLSRMPMERNRRVTMLPQIRDGAYGEVFIRRFRSMGIRDRPTSPRSPRENGYAERLIGSIRRECLDHVVVFGERHLRHLPLSYMKYYNGARTHPWRRMHRSRAPSIAPGTFLVVQSWAGCITMPGFNLRQAQAGHLI